MDIDRADNRKALLELYKVKRTFCFFDEWGLYALLLYMWNGKWPTVMIAGVGLYGAMAIVTTYKNLSAMQAKLGIQDEWMLWPLARDKRDK